MKEIVHLLREKDRRRRGRRKKDRVEEAKSLTCSEQRLAETGVARWNLPDQSASSKRRTQDTRMLTYLPLSNDSQVNGDHFCPVQRFFKEFTSN